jgi:hypothetical protein
MNLRYYAVLLGKEIKADAAYALENLARTGEFLVKEGP